jgi:hypothetical protein
MLVDKTWLDGAIAQNSKRRLVLHAIQKLRQTGRFQRVHSQLEEIMLICPWPTSNSIVDAPLDQHSQIGFEFP